MRQFIRVNCIHLLRVSVEEIQSFSTLEIILAITSMQLMNPGLVVSNPMLCVSRSRCYCFLWVTNPSEQAGWIQPHSDPYHPPTSAGDLPHVPPTGSTLRWKGLVSLCMVNFLTILELSTLIIAEIMLLLHCFRCPTMMFLIRHTSHLWVLWHQSTWNGALLFLHWWKSTIQQVTHFILPAIYICMIFLNCVTDPYRCDHGHAWQS